MQKSALNQEPISIERSLYPLLGCEWFCFTLNLLGWTFYSFTLSFVTMCSQSESCLLGLFFFFFFARTLNSLRSLGSCFSRVNLDLLGESSTGSIVYANLIPEPVLSLPYPGCVLLFPEYYRGWKINCCPRSPT